MNWGRHAMILDRYELVNIVELDKSTDGMYRYGNILLVIVLLVVAVVVDRCLVIKINFD